MSDFTINLLSDNPINEEEFDRFDHKTIANTLVKTIENAPSPFTFGLFGKWGVGKTSIINLMENNLPKDNPTIYFDCWKYQNDSLRRAFLLTLENNLKQKGILDEKYNVRRSLYQTVFETKNVHTRYNWNRFIKLLPSLAIAYVSSIIILLFSGFVSDQINIWEIIGLSFIIPLLHFFSSNIDNIIVSDVRQEMENSLDSPERFEEAFKEIIGKTEASKFIIIFDNIDRSDSKRVVETLSTIKTFLDIPLEEKKLIFIIPCDDDAIKRHVVKNYEQRSFEAKNNKDVAALLDRSNKYADEFLRKFFNSYLQIPGFRDLELVKLARSLLQTTGIPSFDREGLDAVVSNPFRKNPRQIKQFINLLISNYILIKQRRNLEQNDESMLDPILADIRILAKYLILKTRFSDYYQTIFENNFEIEPDDPKFKSNDE